MSKQPQKNVFNITPVDTEELRKSIAKDLDVPDRPLTIQELEQLSTSSDIIDIAPIIDWNYQYRPDPAELRAEEERLMDEVDEELNADTQ